MDLEAQARSGDPSAQIAWANRLDGAGRHDEAVGWLDQAATGGDRTAMVLLGSRLLVGRAAPFDPRRGVPLIYGAAEAGQSEACVRAAVMVAIGLGEKQSFDRALGWLDKAAGLGHPGAGEQLAIIGDDVRAWVNPRAGEGVRDAPSIVRFADFVPRAARDWIMRRAKARLVAAQVYMPESGQVGAAPERSNTGCAFGLIETDMILTLMRARMAMASGFALSGFEPVNVLNYQVGQRFEPHYDFLAPGTVPETLAREGQRRATFLAYLNDDYRGGETAFPEIGWSLKAEAGDGLLWLNTDPEGTPDPLTLHEGRAPTKGEKWVLSQWIRDRPQPIA